MSQKMITKPKINEISGYINEYNANNNWGMSDPG